MKELIKTNWAIPIRNFYSNSQLRQMLACFILIMVHRCIFFLRYVKNVLCVRSFLLSFVPFWKNSNKKWTLKVSETSIRPATIWLPIKISRPSHNGRPTGVTFNNASHHNCSLNLLENRLPSHTLSLCVSPDGTEIIKVAKPGRAYRHEASESSTDICSVCWEIAFR